MKQNEWLCEADDDNTNLSSVPSTMICQTVHSQMRSSCKYKYISKIKKLHNNSWTCHAKHQTCSKYHHVVHLQLCWYHIDMSTIEDHADLFQLAHIRQHHQDQKDIPDKQALNSICLLPCLLGKKWCTCLCIKGLSIHVVGMFNARDKDNRSRDCILAFHQAQHH